MKYLLIIITTIFLFSSLAFGEERKYDDEGNLIPSDTVKAMFFFPDVGVGAAFDIKTRRVINFINIEFMDTDDAPNIIPLKINKLPPYIDIIGDMAVGDGLVMMGVGVRFLPFLEPAVLIFGGYNFNEGQEAYGVAARFGIKF